MSPQSMVIGSAKRGSTLAVTGAVVYPKYLPEGAKHSGSRRQPHQKKGYVQLLAAEVLFLKRKTMLIIFHVKGGLPNTGVAMGGTDRWGLPTNPPLIGDSLR